jgi:hypothetical protein
MYEQEKIGKDTRSELDSGRTTSNLIYVQEKFEIVNSRCRDTLEYSTNDYI